MADIAAGLSASAGSAVCTARMVDPMNTDATAAPGPVLLDVLGEARELGYLGPGPISPHVEHSDGFVAVLRRELASRPLDTDGPLIVELGSGGGIPGLVVADRLPDARVVLVESLGKRAAFLRFAVTRCGWDGRVTVVEQRAELMGHEAQWRAAADAVVARSFGAPAVVAECGAPLLALGGVLVVSEPPPSGAPSVEAKEGRWPAGPLRELGLEVGGTERGAFGYQVLRQVNRCPDRYPRRVGIPSKRPLF